MPSMLMCNYFPKCVKQFVLVIEKQCVICDVGIELLNIQINFRNRSVELDEDLAIRRV
jgi:hypothetical protein